MLFLDLYGIPRAPTEAAHSRLPPVLRRVAETIVSWKRVAHDRRILGRMTLCQLEDLQLIWPDDIRNIRAQS